MKYRADIDGLRAVAVLSVVFYHFGLLSSEGGFVGVDVFFVISGYLITGVVLADIEAGRFSIPAFYERRIRRIYPALALVLLFTTGIAGIIFMPFDFRAYGESLFAAALSAANFYFYVYSGYFNGEAELRPLLHTWSLGVEEQFYLVLPLLLLACGGQKKIVKPVLVVLGFASFGVCLRLTFKSPEAAFFMPWARAWELIIGSCLAVFSLPVSKPKATSLVGAAGGAAILFPVFFYGPETKFPGWAAVVPAIGAAAVIYAGAHGVVGRVLASSPLVFLGKISFSIYLWHWPIVSIFQYVMDRKPTIVEASVMLLATFTLSYWSWKLVEQPARRTDGQRSSTQRTFVLASVFLAVFVAIGGGIRAFGGLPERFPPEIARISKVAFDINPRRAECDSRTPAAIRTGDICEIGAHAAPVSFMLLGDSFADALAPGVHRQAEKLGKRGYVVTRGGCLPLVAVAQGIPGCSESVEAALNLVSATPSIDTVILIGRWSAAAEGVRFGAHETADISIADSHTLHRSHSENREVLKRGLARTFDQLHGRRIFVVAYLPEQRVNVPRRMGLDMHFSRQAYDGVERAVFDRRQFGVAQILGALERHHHFSVIDASIYLCGVRVCRSSKDGMPLYVDDNHISRAAAESLGGMFFDALASSAVVSRP